MILVIIAGGSGTRLWPLSTPEYPKHLLKINDDERSLLQQAYDRARALTDKIYIVSDSSHIQHVKDQLSDLDDDNFIVEPARRGTANCIVAALVHISKKHDNDEPIASVHADHYIRDIDGFKHSFNVADTVSRKEKKIVLVGIEPDYAATVFGYIQKGEAADEAGTAYEVNSFKEKPELSVAQEYFKSGKYLWNSGFFVGSVNTFKAKMKENAPDMLANFEKLSSASDEDYKDAYLSLESDAIDYALIEKVPDLLVVPASFDWMDLGSFGDLHKVMVTDEAGNSTHGDVELEGASNSYVHNDGDTPVALVGLDNVVVVSTPSGILVARKDMAKEVGTVSKRINSK